jgi:hypothetical protein
MLQRRGEEEGCELQVNFELVKPGKLDDGPAAALDKRVVKQINCVNFQETNPGKVDCLQATALEKRGGASF